MADRSYTLGRTDDNDIVLNKPRVSSHHLTVTDHGEDLIIKDLSSKNGTFKYGKKIAQTVLKKDESINVADIEIDYNWIKDKTNHLYKTRTNDFSKEFAELEFIYKEYLMDINRIKKGHTKNLLGLRIILSLIPLLISIIFWNSFNSYPQIRYMLMASSGIILTISMLFTSGSDKIENKLNDRREEFLLNYKCPKCGCHLGNTPWIILADRKTCSQCKAKWVV